MKNKYKKKRLKNIMIFIIIVIIFLILSIKILNSGTGKIEFKSGTQDTTDVKGTPYYEKKEERKVYPKKSYEFIMQYKKVGDLNLSDLYRKIYNLKEKIKNISEETLKLSKKEIEQYYDNNKKEFELLFINKEKFVEFVNNIEFLNNENTQFSYAEFDIDSFENITDDYVRCNISLNYDEGKNSISFSLRVAKNDSNEKYIFTSN